MDLDIHYSNNKLSLMAPTLEGHLKTYALDYLNKLNLYRPIGFFEDSPVYSLYQPPLATRAGIKSFKNRLLRKKGELKAPATATIAVNKACQCDCSHCSAVYYNQASQRDLSSLELTNALAETCALGVSTIILLGGEPLLRKDLFEVISQIPKNEASVILFTNGEYLNDDNCRKLKKAGLMGAFVSLDHPEESQHDQFRKRPGLYKKALQGITNLKNNGLIAGISSHLSHSNLPLKQFEQMVELTKQVGADEITFFDAIPSGQWLHDSSEILNDTDRETISRLVKLYRNKKDYPGLSVQSTLTSPKGSAFCFAANTQFYLTAWGEMCPCDFTPLSIGRYPELSIKQLWDKMTSCAPYHTRAKACRMQDKNFREKYIDTIPAKGPYPYPLNIPSKDDS
ncbi:MAG: Fe-S oxidoreductase [uncultured bacterium]|nr:MAG: Fe-S oxidoreductase [uncultured bacterium]